MFIIFQLLFNTYANTYMIDCLIREIETIHLKLYTLSGINEHYVNNVPIIDNNENILIFHKCK